jgi:O-antigen ligase
MLIKILDNLTEIALYLLLFSLTFSNSATEIFSVSIIVFFVLKRIALKDLKFPATALNIPLYVLCAVIFITFLRSAYFSESIRGFIRIAKYAMLYFAVVDFLKADSARIKRVFWALIIVGVLTYLNGIFQSVSGFDIIRHKQITKDDYLRRIQASFVHPNDFAAYIITVLPLSFCLLSKGLKKGQRALLALNCLLGAYCLLKTSSRSAWVGFAAGLFLYFLFYNKKLALIIPAAGLLFVILTPHGLERITSLFAREQNTVWERTQLWKGTWEMVKVHPFLGFGVNTFSRYFADFKPAEYWGLMYTHNSYLQIWSEIGIAGLAAYIYAIFVTLKKSLRAMNNKIRNSGVNGYILLSAISGYIAFLVQSAFDTNMFSLTLMTQFWIMTAYIVSLSSNLERQNNA